MSLTGVPRGDGTPNARFARTEGGATDLKETGGSRDGIDERAGPPDPPGRQPPGGRGSVEGGTWGSPEAVVRHEPGGSSTSTRPLVYLLKRRTVPMTQPAMDAAATEVPRHPLVPHVVVSIALGALFVVAVLLAAALPALAVVYLVVGFAVRSVVTILVLWAASATLTVLLYELISRTYVQAVLRRRVVQKLPIVSGDAE